MNRPLLTIFTPAYNRAHTLSRLHDSLLAQTGVGFEWLVVDDGSTDGTSELVHSWEDRSAFPIRYIWQKNSGKHVAHNLGAQEAHGLYFMCVDSDDWLEPDAVETIARDAKALDAGAGLLYPKLFDTNTALDPSRWFPSGTLAVELGDVRMRYGLVIETAIVFATETLREHPFPVFEGERYIPEESAYYDFRDPEMFQVHADCFYRCEYLQEGLTKNIWANWLCNPTGTRLALRKRYEAACRYRTLRGLKGRVSSVVGIESLNIGLGVNPGQGLTCGPILRAVLLPMARSCSQDRYGGLTDVARSE
jgi:glycosyltransferase involved in cell wall biosynthesis